MALIDCAECGRQVSDKAAACPSCGCPVASGPRSQAEPTSTSLPPNSMPEPARAKPMFIVAATLFAVTCLWELVAWNASEHAREHYISARVDARLTLLLLVGPAVAVLIAAGFAVVGLYRNARRARWLLEREAPEGAPEPSEVDR